MNELDVAMLFIFDMGLFGLAYEPWSPHPPLMVLVGGVYLGARFAVYIIVTINHKRRKKHYGEERKT